VKLKGWDKEINENIEVIILKVLDKLNELNLKEEWQRLTEKERWEKGMLQQKYSTLEKA